MKDGKFEVGDIVTGTDESRGVYSITTTGGVYVVSKTFGSRMVLLVVYRKCIYDIGSKYEVTNSKEYFRCLMEAKDD